MIDSHLSSEEHIGFIFWNIHNNLQNISRIVELAATRNVYVIALSEVKNIPNELIRNTGYRKVDYINQKNSHDIQLLINKSGIAASNYSVENARYNLIYLRNWDFILAIAHLNSERTPEARQYRQADILNMLEAINRLESSAKCKNTMIIGDLNFGLFDEQMLSFPGLNTRLFLSEMRMSSRIHENEKDCYYNPMLNLYCDNSNEHIAKGTYYYENALEKWCCYDHVLMKQPLIKYFKKIEILSCLSSEMLVNNNKPIQTISDHLPIYFELDFKEESFYE